jgi:hypothetical protein
MSRFTIALLSASATAIRKGLDNTPPPFIRMNLLRLADCLDTAESLFDAPIALHCAYRSLAVNTAVGGAKHSYHLAGCAADFDPPAGMTHDEAQHLLAAHKDILPFDLILEEGTAKPESEGGSRWIHFQIAKLIGETPRYMLKDALVDREGGTILRVSAG